MHYAVKGKHKDVTILKNKYQLTGTQTDFSLHIADNFDRSLKPELRIVVKFSVTTKKISVVAVTIVKGRPTQKIKKVDPIKPKILALSIAKTEGQPPANPPPSSPSSGAPTAEFKSNGSVFEGSSGAVNFSQMTGGSGSYRFSYDFDNDGTFEITASTASSTTVPASFLADGPSTRIIHGRITDSSNHFTDYLTQISVTNRAPSVSAGSSIVVELNSSVSFQATANDPSSVDQAAGFTYFWNFGDGKSATGATVSHTFTVANTYSVQLTVRDKDGANGTATRSVVVNSVSGDNGNPPGGSSSGLSPISYVSANPAPAGSPTPDRDLVTINSKYIRTWFHTIPNFCENPTFTANHAVLTAIASGNWNDASIWSAGRVPIAGDIVQVPEAVSVIYNLLSEEQIDSICIAGRLDFKTDMSTRLRVTNMLVLPQGTLTIGTPTSPVNLPFTANLAFNDLPLDLVNDPEQYGHGLIGLGAITMRGAAKNTTWGRLTAEPKAGDTTLSLQNTVSGWNVGDRLYLADTRQLIGEEREYYTDSSYQKRFEFVNIAQIYPNGHTITLKSPVQYNHLGARDALGALRFLPSVANSTSNVKVNSQNANGTRGHTFYTARADVDLRYVMFGGLGRSQYGLFDNTTFDDAGNVTHIGTNQQDRQPVFFSHLWGSDTAQHDYQFSFRDNVVMCPLEDMKFLWGVATVSSSDGLIDGNFLYNWAGAGIADGMPSAGQGGAIYFLRSSGNAITHNYFSRIRGLPGTDNTPTNLGIRNIAREGAGIWSWGVTFGKISDNLVNHANKGIEVNSNGLIGIASDQDVNANEIHRVLFVPKYKGANPLVEGQYQAKVYLDLPLPEFKRNEVGGNTHDGVSLWSIAISDNRWAGLTEAVPLTSKVEQTSIWNVAHAGLYLYQVRGLSVSDLTIIEDIQRMAQGHFAIGILEGGDYFVFDGEYKDCDIENAGSGIMPTGIGRGQVYKNLVMSNYYEFYLDAPWWLSSAQTIPERSIVVDNLIHLPTPVNLVGSGYPAPTVFQMDNYRQHHPDDGAPATSAIRKDEVVVRNYNQTAGNDFRVFYPDAALNAILVKSYYQTGHEGDPDRMSIEGSPVANLTNAQNYDAFGIWAHGIKPPDNTVADAQITNGFIGAIPPGE